MYFLFEVDLCNNVHISHRWTALKNTNDRKKIRNVEVNPYSSGYAPIWLVSLGVTFCNLNTHAQSLARELIFTFDTSMVIPPPVPPERQFSGPPLEPRRLTVVLDEVTGAPSVTSVVPLGQLRRVAYTDCLSFDCVYLSRRISIWVAEKRTYQTLELMVSFWYFHGTLP